MLCSADPTTLSKPLLYKMLSMAFSSTSFWMSSSSIDSRTRLNEGRNEGTASRHRSRACIAGRLMLGIQEPAPEVGVGGGEEKAPATLMLVMTSSVVLRATAMWTPCPTIAAGARQEGR